MEILYQTPQNLGQKCLRLSKDHGTMRIRIKIKQQLLCPATITYSPHKYFILQVIWRKEPFKVPIMVGKEQFLEIKRFQLLRIPHKDEWTLLIKNTQPFDSGTYECQVSLKGSLPGIIAQSVAMSLGNQEAPRSILASGTSFREDLVMKIFLRPFFL